MSPPARFLLGVDKIVKVSYTVRMATPNSHIETYDERVEREKREDAARNTALVELAGAVAHEMRHYEVSVKVHNDFPHVTYVSLRRIDGGASFSLGYDWRDKSKVHVTAHWPKDASGKEHRPYFSEYSENGSAAPSIAFSAKKDAKVIAKDIERRFLPAFLPLWDKMVEEVTKNNDYATKRAALAKSVAGLLDGKVAKHRDGGDIVHLGYREHGITDVDFGGDEKALKVEVRCTLAELAELVKLFPPKKGDGQ
jgi:hypothetical protein